MTLSQLLLIVSAALAGLDAFGTRPWTWLNRTAAAIALLAVAICIAGTTFNHTLFA